MPWNVLNRQVKPVAVIFIEMGSRDGIAGTVNSTRHTNSRQGTFEYGRRQGIAYI